MASKTASHKSFNWRQLEPSKLTAEPVMYVLDTSPMVSADKRGKRSIDIGPGGAKGPPAVAPRGKGIGNLPRPKRTKGPTR
eukprot:7374680-Pyramimonas_sp.AAC.1